MLHISFRTLGRAHKARLGLSRAGWPNNQLQGSLQEGFGRGQVQLIKSDELCAKSSCPRPLPKGVAEQLWGPGQKPGIAQTGYFLPGPTQDKEKPHGKEAGRAREGSGSSRSPGRAVLGDIQDWIQLLSALSTCGWLQVLLCVPGAGDLWWHCLAAPVALDLCWSCKEEL